MGNLWRPVTRSLDTHFKSVFLSPPKPSCSSATTTATTLSRTFSTASSAVFLSLPETLVLPKPFHLSQSRYLPSNHPCNLTVVRCFFSLFPLQSNPTVEWNEPVSYSEVDDDVYPSENESDDPDPRGSIPVRAFFFCTSVDLKGLVDQKDLKVISTQSRMSNYVVVQFGDYKPGPNGLCATLSGSDCRFMVVFQYGSIVLFNVRDHEVDAYLKIVERFASGQLHEVMKDGALHHEMRKDEYEVREKPNLSTWMQAGLDHIMLQYLNIDGIRTIGSVLGQSIALDYYVRQVDGMVAEFTDINRAMEKTGTFEMERKKLFQLVGKANSNLADVILKLGLFERFMWKRLEFEGQMDAVLRYGVLNQGKGIGNVCIDHVSTEEDSVSANFDNNMFYKSRFTSYVNSSAGVISDIAWKDAKYAQIWEYLRDEFELTQRFASLDFKLKFVEHNIRFLQEILQNRKSDFLEWLIIILIGAEILISVYDIAHKSAITSL
ncbi:hypothetical protein Cgig2_009790 [Carnegiea gigantea]|uniref:DUF155 domain-containing protein n=1 Tax=Carnegiea gigantea TaxID=171969 RepID=A0A9Q1Q3Z8_9CARY|nr:hypothetical protein Cgig2_009790 [Carnegiea gigantea]